jgi:small subunit ribosomal protein S4
MVIRAKEKKERALGERLFLKAYRSQSHKSAMVRRPYRPGVHGKRRQSVSDYGTQLKAKQKFKLTYGVNESQLTNIYREAARSEKGTGERMIEMLERRLDNAIFRAGLAPSRIMARHFIVRGHYQVNGVKTVSPSFSVKVGDIIKVKEESKVKSPFKNFKEALENYSTPDWLDLAKPELTAKVKALPTNVDPAYDISAVVEFFAKNN